VVYEWLEEDGLSVIGGRDSSVGMGFLIGGTMLSHIALCRIMITNDS
jgi:hypothetical protein